MKIKIGISVLIALVMSSCAGFLDEDTRGRQEQSTFYTSEGLAFAGLTGLYQRIFTAQTFRENLSNRQDACSDLHTYKPVASADAYCFPRYTLTPEQVHVGNPWTGLYLAIFTANEFIRAMETNTVIDQAAREEFMREAKVIRAIMYYHLINRWGDVPMIMEPIEDTSVTDRARTPKAEIWQQLIVDLEDAAANLPAKGTARKGGGDGKGRIDKGVAAFVLARVHLSNVANLNSTDHFTKAKAVLDNFPAGYSLMPSIKKVWKMSNEYNAESILEFSNTAGQMPTQGLAVLNFYLPTGSWRGPNGTYPVNDYLLKMAGFGNWDDVSQATSWYNTPGLSERTLLYYTSNPVKGLDPANLHTQYKYTKQDGTVQTINFNGSTLAYNSHLVKFVDLPSYTNWGDHASGNTDVNLIVYRYAEVVLMKAEVECEVGDQATALALLNSIRKRPEDVGDKLYTMTAGVEGQIYLADKAALREAIRNERALELVGEGSRFYDLKRWGNEYALAKLRLSRQTNIPGTVEDYVPTDLTNITENKLLWPIPEAEIEGNALMEQNPL